MANRQGPSFKFSIWSVASHWPRHTKSYTLLEFVNKHAKVSILLSLIRIITKVHA